MKIFVAHLDPYNGDQSLIHAVSIEALRAKVCAWIREDLAKFDRYRPDMTDAQVVELFNQASESSYYIDEIDLTLAQPWKLADDPDYGEQMGWYVLTTLDGEDELRGGPWATEDECRAYAAENNIFLP